jgi:DNA-directed RNA polymerase II subunit RPB1
MKALEDYKVTWSKCVKDAQNNIIQYLYGDDNIDGISMEKLCVPLVECQDYLDEFVFQPSEMFNISEEENDKLLKLSETMKEMLDYYSNDICDNNPESSIKFPVHIKRTFHSVLETNVSSNPLTVNKIMQTYDDLFDRISLQSYNDGLWMFKFMLFQHAHPKKLINEHMNETQFQMFVETIEVLFNRAQIEAGDAVGPVAAQSIGEPCTQLTLNTFHLSGVGGKSTVTRGVPRLQELFHLSKNPKNPSLTIKLIPSLIHDKSSVQRVSTEIGLIPLRDLVIGSEVRHEAEHLYEEFNEFNKLFKCFDNSEGISTSKWVLTIMIDRTILLDKHIEMEEIFNSITTLYDRDIHCEYSDDNSEETYIRIRVNPNSLEFKKGLISDGIPEISILSMIETKLMDSLVIRGINSIQSATLRQNVGSGSKKEWLLDTVGSNIVDVMLHPDVDKFRTTSNDIHEMNSVFGIEAARQTLINEIHEVMDEASEIDPRHVHLLADMMSNKGVLIPIDRNGMKLTEVGAFAKCSFEEADQQLYKASIFGETDKITGVSSNIILGQAPPVGTGTVDVSLDEEKYFDLLSECIDNSSDDESDSLLEDEEITFDVDD